MSVCLGLRGVSSYTDRSHTCGELGAHHVGEEVRLCGWVQHRRMGKFITMRDSFGATQVTLHNQVYVTNYFTYILFIVCDLSYVILFISLSTSTLAHFQ